VILETGTSKHKFWRAHFFVLLLSDQMMHYVRSLEQRVKQLEEEKLALQQKLGQVPGINSTNELRSSGSWENDVRDQMMSNYVIALFLGMQNIRISVNLGANDDSSPCRSTYNFSMFVLITHYVYHHVCVSPYLCLYSPVTLNHLNSFH